MLCEIKAVPSLLNGSGKRLPSLSLVRPQSMLQEWKTRLRPLALTLPKAHTTLAMPRASHELLEASVCQ